MSSKIKLNLHGLSLVIVMIMLISTVSNAAVYNLRTFDRPPFIYYYSGTDSVEFIDKVDRNIPADGEP